MPAAPVAPTVIPGFSNNHASVIPGLTGDLNAKLLKSLQAGNWRERFRFLN